jgi:hypothetical protein
VGSKPEEETGFRLEGFQEQRTRVSDFYKASSANMTHRASVFEG